MVMALALVSCQRNASTAPSGDPTLSPVATLTPTGEPVPAATAGTQPTPTASSGPEVLLDELPAPDQPFPTQPRTMAREIASTSDRLEGAIDRWTEGGDPSTGQPPREVVLLALYQQRMYRYLARHSNLAERTIVLLPRSVAAEARDIVTAGHRLFSLVRAVPSATTFKVQSPEPAGVLLRYYRQAERRFRVSWEVLAAVNYIESKFGRVKSASYAGAQGPMQFIPATWRAYGLGGDIHDPHDAILGAANYLHASGAPPNYRAALYHYNRSSAYVDAVLRYARRMAKDDRMYYALYNWQVFVLTTSGDRRLTGPGL